MSDLTNKLQKAICELLEQIDDDCPQDLRSKHLIAAMGDARALIGQSDEVPIRILTACPKCGADDSLDYRSIDIEGNTCLQVGSCGNCETEWTEYYKYAGHTITNP